MKTVYYIDGNNLLHAWKKTSHLMRKKAYRQSQKLLIEKIKHSPLFKKSSFEIFFDGEVPSYSFAINPSKMKLTFCYPETADARIAEKLRMNYQKKIAIVVVSDDLEVRQSARRYDFTDMKNREFINKIEVYNSNGRLRDEEESKPDITEDEIEIWKDIFSQENHEDDE